MAGGYTVTVAAIGYASQSFSVTIKAGTTSIRNFALAKAVVTTGVLSDTVTSAATGTAQAVAADLATGDPYLDDFTGMPDYRQVNYEITVVMKGTGTGEPTPWADMERNGKWY